MELIGSGERNAANQRRSVYARISWLLLTDADWTNFKPGLGRFSVFVDPMVNILIVKAFLRWCCLKGISFAEWQLRLVVAIFQFAGILFILKGH
jgi:hypothetical protein